MQVRVRDRRGAFTLIELLVVVAIIALLISILLPSLSRAKAQARTIICSTNLREQNRSAYYYSEDNNGFIGRGLMGFAASAEYNIYATTVLRGLGFEGATIPLWRPTSTSSFPTPRQQRFLRRALLATPQFQCPDYPNEGHTFDQFETDFREDTQTLDYVASAMAIPYPKINVDLDRADASARPGDSFEGVRNQQIVYIETSKLDEIALVKSPASMIYVSEAHVSLPWDDLRFHHFFLTSQLSFGAKPRVASDQRHPGGINAMFFDGHVETMGLTNLDAGWGHSVGIRLRWFSALGADVAQSDW
jgi:prepilin-type processing-associated H-X9-DG protein/prepilin-type N-terminal cleavage/methylation domain-containing protein